jgi:hypothetical protein
MCLVAENRDTNPYFPLSTLVQKIHEFTISLFISDIVIKKNSQDTNSVYTYSVYEQRTLLIVREKPPMCDSAIGYMYTVMSVITTSLGRDFI